MSNYHFLKKNIKEKGHIQSYLINHMVHAQEQTNEKKGTTAKNKKIKKLKTGQIDPWIYSGVTTWVGDDRLFTILCLEHWSTGSLPHQLYLWYT